MAEHPPTVRRARERELAAVMNVLDGAALEVDAATVGDRISEAVLVAVDDDRVLGVCVVDHHGSHQARGGNSTGEATSAEVEAVAVRPGRRDQGIGSALVAAAARRWGPLAAEFDHGVRPFYESLGFEVVPIDGDRYRGIRPADRDGETHPGGEIRSNHGTRCPGDSDSRGR